MSIFTVFLFFLLMSCKENEQDVLKQPNVVIIHVDDLGYSDLGCFGSQYYETPNIDQLAIKGMKFTSSYAAAAVCSPTRAAMMTGKYPARLGITDWIRARFQGGIIPPDGNNPVGYDENDGKLLKTPKNPLFLDLKEKTMADYFKEAGYYSAHIGKWHLGQEEHYPEYRGFDENVGGCDLGQPPSYFDPYIPTNGNSDYKIPNLPPRKEGEYLTDREGDEAVDFVMRNKGGKFFLHWAPYAVHTPIQSKRILVEKYEKKTPTHQLNPAYAAMVESLDQNVGKLVHALDSLGLSENTIIIFTSDNGGFLGNSKNPITNNFPLRSGKGYPYEGGIKVPTIVKWPKVIKGGTQNDTPIITMDILPTLIGRIQPDFDLKESRIDGKDLFDIWNGQSESFERDLFWHFPHYRTGGVVPYTVIRSDKYKLIKYYDGTRSELYDLQKDKIESTDLILEQPEIASELENKISEWVNDTDAKLPIEKANL